jgi:copper chaperone CopZ
MKKFVQRVQEIGNKAAHIKAALESVPPKVADVRQAVASTAVQLQQLRSDVQSTVSELQLSDEQLIEALREIDDSAETFRRAGYEVFDVEMELAVPPRLLVHLEKVEDVSASAIQSLIASNQANHTVHAILVALLKAEQMADRVALKNLSYHRLTVQVGTMPRVRLCWGAPTEAVAPATASTPVISAATPAASSPSAAPAFGSSLFGQSSFFEQRSPATPKPSAAVEAAPTQPSAASSTKASEAKPEASSDPLARFKRMPDLSKRG